MFGKIFCNNPIFSKNFIFALPDKLEAKMTGQRRTLSSITSNTFSAVVLTREMVFFYHESPADGLPKVSQFSSGAFTIIPEAH
ncbi:Hypothetical protein NTJ_16181 [Nesidiocoris tenuis]|uniref:GRAM domain-containing protein n=1 Tax=Nesidiocoris tenuis TaxID=355587 RepID=A0ABN7BGA1_9HEMI|nr:Hypothetical protein NTJ_16181 [Nesidiocoris tenuis]